MRFISFLSSWSWRECVTDHGGELQAVSSGDIFLTVGPSHRPWQVVWSLPMHWEDRIISCNDDQGADKDVGGGEDPEVLQKVPQKEISAEGIKKEGFHFDDYCNLNLDDNDVEHYQRADTKERWKKHIEGEDYVPSPPSASSLTRSGRAPSKRFYENQSLDSSWCFFSSPREARSGRV